MNFGFDGFAMKKPNIVLISIDTLRADHVSCYGYERKTTPCLDQLAEEGILFENSYSTGVWTPPGHGSMLTGLHPCQHGATGKNRLRKSVPTLAEILQNNGYRTVGLINNPQVGELVGFDRGHEIFCEVWRGVRARTVIDRGVRFIHRKALSALHRLDKGAKKTTDLAIKWLGENAKSGYPFYLFIHFIEPKKARF